VPYAWTDNSERRREEKKKALGGSRGEKSLALLLPPTLTSAASTWPRGGGGKRTKDKKNKVRTTDVIPLHFGRLCESLRIAEEAGREEKKKQRPALRKACAGTFNFDRYLFEP